MIRTNSFNTLTHLRDKSVFKTFKMITTYTITLPLFPFFSPKFSQETVRMNIYFLYFYLFYKMFSKNIFIEIQLNIFLHLFYIF